MLTNKSGAIDEKTVLYNIIIDVTKRTSKSTAFTDRNRLIKDQIQSKTKMQIMTRSKL